MLNRFVVCNCIVIVKQFASSQVTVVKKTLRLTYKVDKIILRLIENFIQFILTKTCAMIRKNRVNYAKLSSNIRKTIHSVDVIKEFAKRTVHIYSIDLTNPKY